VTFEELFGVAFVFTLLVQENRGTLQIFGLDLSLLLIRIKATQGLSVRGSED
jgi:hypothetical protein